MNIFISQAELAGVIGSYEVCDLWELPRPLAAQGVSGHYSFTCSPLLREGGARGGRDIFFFFTLIPPRTFASFSTTP